MAAVQVPTALGFTLVWQSAFQRITLAGNDADLRTQAAVIALLTVLPSAFFYFVATQIGTGAVTYLVGKACVDETVGVLEAYRWALRRALPLFGTAILVAAAAFGGLGCFVVPGVIVYLVTFAAVPAVMLEDLGVKAGLRRSYELATGSLARVALVRVVFALFILVSVLVGWLLLQPFSQVTEVQLLLVQIPASFAGPLDAISTVLLYYDLRVRREGLDLERMAAELEGA